MPPKQYRVIEIAHDERVEKIEDQVNQLAGQGYMFFNSFSSGHSATGGGENRERSFLIFAFMGEIAAQLSGSQSAVQAGETSRRSSRHSRTVPITG